MNKKSYYNLPYNTAELTVPKSIPRKKEQKKKETKGLGIYGKEKYEKPCK